MADEIQKETLTLDQVQCKSSAKSNPVMISNLFRFTTKPGSEISFYFIYNTLSISIFSFHLSVQYSSGIDPLFVPITSTPEFVFYAARVPAAFHLLLS